MRKFISLGSLTFVALVAIAGCNKENTDKDRTASQTTSSTVQGDGTDRPGGPGPGGFGGPNGRGPGPGRRTVDWAAKVAAADKSKLPPAADTKDVSFEKDIRPLFEAACFRCHGSERARGNFHLDTLENVLKGGEHGTAVIAGKSSDSPLVIAIAQIDPDLAMPPRGPGRPRGPGGGPGGPGAGGDFPDRPRGPGGDGQGGREGGGPGGQGGPPGGFGAPAKALTPEQVSLVRAWIDQGAK